MHFKYDATAEQDNQVVERVVELADRYGVEMTQISLAWLLTKVESPIVGATKLHHIEGAVKSLDVRLTADDIRYPILMSDCFDFDEETFRNIMVHEMIHYYLCLNNPNDCSLFSRFLRFLGIKNSDHGPEFMAMAQKLN